MNSGLESFTQILLLEGNIDRTAIGRAGKGQNPVPPWAAVENRS
jgi:hypothetical protein